MTCSVLQPTSSNSSIITYCSLATAAISIPSRSSLFPISALLFLLFSLLGITLFSLPSELHGWLLPDISISTCQLRKDLSWLFNLKYSLNTITAHFPVLVYSQHAEIVFHLLFYLNENISSTRKETTSILSKMTEMTARHTVNTPYLWNEVLNEHQIK